MRLANKKAIVVGAGQTPGETIGNGRATAILFAREGAEVMCVDRRIDSARETVAMIKKEGGNAFTNDAKQSRAFARQNGNGLRGALSRVHPETVIPGFDPESKSALAAGNRFRLKGRNGTEAPFQDGHYLASDEANFVTGAILPVDGGQTAKST